MPYLMHILTLWLYSSSLIGVNFFTLLDKSYKKTTKNFQSILKTDSKLSAFFHRFRLFINVNLKMYSFDHLRMYNIDHINTCCSRW